MSQTIFALLALMIATSLSFNQDRAMMQVRGDMIDSEMEVMASGVALQVMEYIGRKAFDDQTAGGSKVTSLGALTGVGGFGVDGQCDVVAPVETTYPYRDCDDLDDFHQMEMERVPFILESDTVFFEVTTKVHYVNVDGNETTSPTFDKKVVVYVQHTGPKKYFKSSVVLSRTFSYERMRRSN